MGLKSTFIESLRQTPEGINAFLNTAIPPLEATTKPTTVDDAQITQGILAHNFNLILKPLEGLTPIELLLRIGQHSNVAEAMLFSGLEYIEDPESAEKDFTIKEPVEGTKYAQGDIRIIVEAKNGTIGSVTVNCNDPFVEEEGGIEFDVELNADETGTTFYGMARCEGIGEWILTFTVTFNDSEKTIKTASVAFEIAVADEDTTNPEGEDLTAFNTSLEILDQYYQEVIKAASTSDPVPSDSIQKVFSSTKILAGLVFSLTAKKVIQIPVEIIQAVIDEVEVLNKS